MESRLAILMETFGISGKDLSGLLHIDSSLVSKWRSGKRYLKPNSVYTNQIIKHVMALDRSNQYAKVRMMLSSEYVNIFKCSESEVTLFLKDWLTASKAKTESTSDYFDEIKNLKSTSSLLTYSMSGYDARRQAIQFFLKYAQNVSPGIEIWMYTTENLDWFYNNDTFFDEWQMRLMSLLEEKNKIKVIQPVCRYHEEMAISMLTWMPMLMTGRASAYFVPKYKDEQLAYTYMLIRDHMALYNWSQKQQTGDLNTYITHESRFVRDIEVMMNSYFNESTPIFKEFTYATRDDYLNDLISILERENDEYHWCASFPLFIGNEESNKQVLLENGVCGVEADVLLENMALAAELSDRSNRCFFINTEWLRAALRRDYVVINNMSHICGRSIKVSHDLFIQLIRQSMEYINSKDKIKICLATSEQLQRIKDTEILAKDNTSVHFTNVMGAEERLLSTKELMIVASIYSYLENLWNTTPYISRNKEYVNKRVLKEIEEANAARAAEGKVESK